MSFWSLDSPAQGALHKGLLNVDRELHQATMALAKICFDEELPHLKRVEAKEALDEWLLEMRKQADLFKSRAVDILVERAPSSKHTLAMEQEKPKRREHP